MSKLLSKLKETFKRRSLEPAISFGQKTWTYLDLDQRSDLIAHNLVQIHKVKTNDIVAIRCAKSLDQMALLIALVKIGATYLPIDVDLPEQRAEYILSHSKANLVITADSLAELVKPVSATFTIPLPPEHGFYLLYTSGSTGTPKGVLMGSLALNHLLEWQSDETSLKERSITLQFAPLGFDVHFQEIFATLTCGGHLVMVSENDRKDMTKLIAKINEEKINRLYLPFVAFNLLAEVTTRTNKQIHSVREITVAGEQLKITPYIRDFFNLHTEAVLFNHYGPTETHVVTSLKLDPKTVKVANWPELPSIGFATGTNKVHIVDSDLNEVMQGETGEILLAGLSLADGYYLNDSENTKRFLKHEKFGRVYRTNDLAKVLPNGEIEFLGRNDRQMKIRGHRVELGEIEVQTLKISQALTCAVIPYKANEQTYLKAFVSGTVFKNSEIKELLKATLPDFMIPDVIEVRKLMPLTSSGKIDYQKLTTELNSSLPVNTALNQSHNQVQTQEKIKAIWKKYLPVTDFDLQTSFFDLGGNSLSLSQMMMDVNDVLKVDLNLVDVFDSNTIEKLAALCSHTTLTEKNQTHEKAEKADKIAIIAAHGHLPQSADLQTFWKNLLAQKNLVSSFDPSIVHPLTKTDESHVYISGEYPDGDTFDYEHFGMSLLESQLMDPQQRKFLELCFEVLYLAGYPATKNEPTHKNTGVFASMSSSRYADLVREFPDKVNILGSFATSLGIEKDYLATRVAHKLNLGGPAININTACSSSLVAVIQAVESLRAGNCDMALAGGIAIAALEHEGHSHNEGSIYSENDQCRVFDSQATGTIFTHGSGVVVLKRLADAERDQDNILGLIAGVGLSNDGADKMSFMGPSIAGQAEAIAKAQADAKISAEQLLFVEAHGTGTPIGDPAEVTGLTRAFERQTSKKEFAYISSVKANVGHLNAASGVVGLIKASQVLRTNILPAQIHVNTVNPLLKLKQTPFKISTQNTILNTTPENRFAGVSSFGVGGTNAHVILEAYQASQQDDHVTLVFPGFGSQYSKMGTELLASFSEVLSSELNLLNSALTRQGLATAQSILNSSDLNLATQQLQIFIYQYLLAKLVINKFNLKNISLLGCSLGEISAACVSGLISIDDTIHFVSDRTGLLKNAPEGAMLLISGDKKDYASMLSAYDVESAIVYSDDMFVATGLKESIQKFKTALENKGTHSLLIESVYPHHSTKLQGSENELKAMTNGLTLLKSSYNFIKTGDSKYNITDLEYWQTHHFHKIDFTEAVKSLLASQKKSLIIEIGPQTYLNQQIKKTAVKYFSKSTVSLVNLSTHTAKNESSSLVLGLNEIALAFEGDRLNRKTSSLTKKVLKKTKVTLPQIHRKNQTIMQQTNANSLDSLIQQLLNMFNNDLGYTTDPTITDVNKTHFFELGLDSLMLTQMSSLVKAKFKTSVSFRELKEKYSTLETLAAYIAEKNPPPAATVMPAATPPATTTTMTTISSEPVAAVHTTPAIQNNIVSTQINTVVNASALENIIQMQLQLMQEQMNMLKGHTTTTTANQTTTQTLTATVSTNQQPAPIAQATASTTTTLGVRTKETFGAQAKINLHSTYTNDPIVRQNIKNFEKKYNQKTSASKEFAERSRAIHADPRAVSGFRPETKEMTYPIVVKKSDGQYLWDLNDNTYIDMLCGFGSNFFGNKNQQIMNAMQKQLQEGIEVGPQHSLTLDVARLVSELTGNERVAFCNTGSEAVLGAMRIARTVTAKKKIISFSGAYHGINDDVIVRTGANGQTIPAASGICPESVTNTVVLEYGVQASLDYIRANADDIAGVLVEPVQSRRCNFHPAQFLKDLRTLTSELDICLIFDEIITGFRIQADGAQGFFNIKADLCTYGKIVGGGLPIGIVAGKAKYMNALDGGPWSFGDDSSPQDGVTYFAGTFVRHPLALAACKASLEIIKSNPQGLFGDLNKKSEKFVNELNQIFANENFPLTFDRFGSLMKPRWTATPLASEVFFAILRYNGVHSYDGFPWFVNLAHTEAQLQEVIAVFKKAINEMKILGLFTTSTIPAISATMPHIDFIESKTENRTIIGKDKNGFPAKFVEDKNNPGNYIQITGDLKND